MDDQYKYKCLAFGPKVLMCQFAMRESPRRGFLLIVAFCRRLQQRKRPASQHPHILHSGSSWCLLGREGAVKYVLDVIAVPSLVCLRPSSTDRPTSWALAVSFNSLLRCPLLVPVARDSIERATRSVSSLVMVVAASCKGHNRGGRWTEGPRERAGHAPAIGALPAGRGN